MNEVKTVGYPQPEYNRREILRYMGQKTPDSISDSLIDKCISLTDGQLSYRVCWTKYGIEETAGGIRFAEYEIKSRDLKKNLSGCGSVILFCASVGLNMDRLTKRYSAVSPAMHSALQATGAERVETLCDIFNSEVNEKYLTAPRYSPGYGDVDIKTQEIFFALLNPEKNIGVTLGGDCMMRPTKSVTAFIGIKGNRNADT